MDEAFFSVTAAASGMICLALSGAVLSRRVHDGVVIKVGLICMALGFGAMGLLMLEWSHPLVMISVQRAQMLIDSGIAVVIIGYALKRHKWHRRGRELHSLFGED